MFGLLAVVVVAVAGAEPAAGASTDSGPVASPFHVSDLHQRLTLASECTDALSFCHTRSGRVLIRYGGHVLRDNRRCAFAEGGLYVTAIHNDALVFNEQYNTSQDKRAGQDLLRDIGKLPSGAYVIVAAHYAASERFDAQAMQALQLIGGQKGLLDAPGHTSYLCLGVKGLVPGEAIEHVGQRELSHCGTRADQAASLTKPREDTEIKPIPVGVSHRRFEQVGHNYGRPIELWLYRPRNYDPDMEILFVIHGSGRGGKTHLTSCIEMADRYGCLLAVPEFSPELYHSGPGFHWNGLPRWGQHAWPSTLIELAFDYIKQCIANVPDTYKIIGHSAGGQLVHRIVMFCPDARISLAVAGSAGIYCMPDFDEPFPTGLKGQEFITREMLRRSLQRDMIVLVGQRDTGSDPKDTLNAKQGRGHVARGRRYVAKAREIAKELDVPCAWRFREVPDAGHNHKTMFRGAERYLFTRRP